MIQLSFIVSESYPNPFMLLWYIGTWCVHHNELDPEDQSKVRHLEFDLGKSQFLLLFPVVLKFSLPL